MKILKTNELTEIICLNKKFIKKFDKWKKNKVQNKRNCVQKIIIIKREHEGRKFKHNSKINKNTHSSNSFDQNYSRYP